MLTMNSHTMQNQSTLMNTAIAALPAALPVADPSKHEYLSLRIGAEHYGIAILKVQEIRNYETPTRLPDAPPHMLGVLDLRGVIVPVFDGRSKLGAMASFEPSTVTIILQIQGRQLGLVVDAVLDVRELQTQDIKPAPALGSQPGPGWITGLASDQDGGQLGMLILLDIERLLAHSP